MFNMCSREMATPFQVLCSGSMYLQKGMECVLWTNGGR